MVENQKIVKTYVDALVGATSDLASCKNTYSQLIEISSVFEKVPQLAEYLDSPRITNEAKNKTIDTILQVCNQSDKELKNFVRILAGNARFSILPHIIEYLDLEILKKDSKIRALITSAFELSNEEQKEIEASLSKKLGMAVVATYQINSKLIGGFKVRVEDTVFDCSIKKQLENLKVSLSPD